jgi:hypothetical protein
MHIHFDGDLLVYRAGFAAEKQQWQVVDCGGGIEATFTTKREAEEAAQECNEWPDDQRCFEATKGDRLLEPVENALHNVRTMVDKALENLGATVEDMTMYISGKTNFRDGVATIKPYKGNRDETHKPVHGPAIRQYLRDNYVCNESRDEEADDVVGYSHYGMWVHDPQSTVIVTVDKDLDMIPGLHYNFVKDESYYVDEHSGDKWFYLQLLMGDSTDNIPGIPRVGPARASKMLAPFDCVEDWYAVCKEAYDGAYEDGLDALIENARLLWIRRYPNEWWIPPVEEDQPNE